jgi:hypothetical protein
MMALTTEELAAMQAEAIGMLPDTCTIKRPSQTPDGAGGFTTSYDDTYTGVPCRRGPAGGSERIMAEKLTDVRVWTVTLPAGTDIQTGDLIAIDGYAGTLKVAGWNDRSWEITRRVVCVEGPNG